jgi:hypothetical protein
MLDDVLVQLPATMCALMPSLLADSPCPTEDIGFVGHDGVRHPGAGLVEFLAGFFIEGKKPNMLRVFADRI